ncbi:hypothetical protein HNP46_003219 [Pseudomonas nitritireducens]|uniref:DUF3757 domain-containing protein n=1 Tax=Pseudomonas nitroreducens TaxID=46680 RepID=A0A7W7KK90_PSENT|nr:hypothetical protein [Pseudomonas nitritireducens]MBB4864355.1 hypothetical protein [Pseudomonas nitritireducens]
MKAVAVAALLLSLGAAQAANAGDWQVCQLEVEITGTLKQPVRGLQGRVQSAKPRSAGTQCPSQGELIAFEPETADWQSRIPRKHWPAPGQRVWMRYQYLDGWCKRDGNDGPCRIEHYPMGW